MRQAADSAKTSRRCIMTLFTTVSARTAGVPRQVQGRFHFRLEGLGQAMGSGHPE